MLDKRLACTIGALLVVAAVSIMLARIPDGDDVLELREELSNVEIEEPGPEAEYSEEKHGEEYAYVLREHEGRIGVFVPGEKEPEMILDVFVRFLPDYDRMLMQEGIPARDYNHLIALIEDYIS